MTKKEKYILLKCIKFGKEKLGLTSKFTLQLSNSRDGFKTTGYYDPEKHIIGVYMGGRKVYDCCRTALHELTHAKQNEDNRVKGDVPDIGGVIEDEANSKSGSMLKLFAYKLLNEEKIDIYEL